MTPTTTSPFKTAAEYGITALSGDMNAVLEAMQFNLGASSASDLDLPKITVPTGGGDKWIVSGLKSEILPALVGVIVLARDTRSYWANPIDSSAVTPPDCSSRDGVHGIGSPGGECASCPLNQFGSDGRGKSCGEYKQLFMLRGTNLLPEVVAIPPTSLGAAKKYLVQLLAQGLPYVKVVTSLTLNPVKNSAGKPYSEVRFEMVAPLAGPDVAAALQFHQFTKELAGARPQSQLPPSPANLGNVQ